MNIEAKELSKIYGSGEGRVFSLDKVNLEIASGDFISIMGPSGTAEKAPCFICCPGLVADLRHSDIRWKGHIPF